jgi:hypothetical protein
MPDRSKSKSSYIVRLKALSVVAPVLHAATLAVFKAASATSQKAGFLPAMALAGYSSVRAGSADGSGVGPG